MAGLQAQLTEERRLRGEAEAQLEAEQAKVAALSLTVEGMRQTLSLQSRRIATLEGDKEEGDDVEVDVIDAAGSGGLKIMASTRVPAPSSAPRKRQRVQEGGSLKLHQHEQQTQLVDPQVLVPSGIVQCNSCSLQLRWPEGVLICRCPCGVVLRLHQPPSAAANVVECGACSRHLRWPVGHDACRCPCGVVLQQPISHKYHQVLAKLKITTCFDYIHAVQRVTPI